MSVDLERIFRFIASIQEPVFTRHHLQQTIDRSVRGNPDQWALTVSGKNCPETELLYYEGSDKDQLSEFTEEFEAPQTVILRSYRSAPYETKPYHFKEQFPRARLIP